MSLSGVGVHLLDDMRIMKVEKVLKWMKMKLLRQYN
jgi:hypothetical protein